MKLQTDDYQCGPIALINAYIYLNKKHPPISTRRIAHEISTTENGTDRWNLAKNSLLKLGKPTYNKNKILEMKAFILLYSFSRSNAHYVFIIKLDDGNFQIFNYYNNENETYVNSIMDQTDFFQKILNKNPKISNLDYPLAWPIN